MAGAVFNAGDSAVSERAGTNTKDTLVTLYGMGLMDMGDKNKVVRRQAHWPQEAFKSLKRIAVKDLPSGWPCSGSPLPGVASG